MSIRTGQISFKPPEDADCGEYCNRLVEYTKQHYSTLADADVNQIEDSNGTLTILSSKHGPATFMIRFYKKDRIFIFNTEALESSAEFKNINYCSRLQDKNFVENTLEAKNVHAGPVVRLNGVVPLYGSTSDDRQIEYDYDQLLVHEKTPYQDVKICHSPTFGNVLLLDELQNLAESDIAYTQGLMNYGNNDYKDKDILILGGGDGALLHELLKESPRFVTMVDIDEVVLKACAKYLRGACGDTLDNYDGPHHKVIVGDCIAYLKQYIEEGRTFDCIFNDLTDIPVSIDESHADHVASFYEQTQTIWDFIKTILLLALQVLRPNGIYLNHANGTACTKSLQQYETLLQSLDLKFTKHAAYVPSFYEEWGFYQVTKS